MYQNDLIRIFRAIIRDGLIARGFGDIPVIRSYQPTEQGVSTNATVYYDTISNYQYGFLGRSAFPNNPDPDKMNLVETQYYEATYQISGLVISNPLNTNTFTALDLVSTVASILSSDASRETLKLSDIGILRITDIRNQNFIDDRDRFEQSPNFDFVLTYKQVNISEIPIVKTTELDIYPVI